MSDNLPNATNNRSPMANDAFVSKIDGKRTYKSCAHVLQQMEMFFTAHTSVETVQSSPLAWQLMHLEMHG
jgi:hypothetical protein